jgi:hypothetical protein
VKPQRDELAEQARREHAHAEEVRRQAQRAAAEAKQRARLAAESDRQRQKELEEAEQRHKQAEEQHKQAQEAVAAARERARLSAEMAHRHQAQLAEVSKPNKPDAKAIAEATQRARQSHETAYEHAQQEEEARRKSEQDAAARAHAAQVAELARKRAQSAAAAARLHAEDSERAQAHDGHAEEIRKHAETLALQARQRAEQAKAQHVQGTAAADHGASANQPGTGTGAGHDGAPGSGAAAQAAYKKALGLRARPDGGGDRTRHEPDPKSQTAQPIANSKPETAASESARAQQAIRVARERAPRTPSPSTLEGMRAAAVAKLTPYQQALSRARVARNTSQASTKGRPVLAARSGPQPIVTPRGLTAGKMSHPGSGSGASRFRPPVGKSNPVVTVAVANLGKVNGSKPGGGNQKPSLVAGAGGNGAAFFVAGVLVGAIGDALLLQSGAFGNIAAGSIFNSGSAFIPNDGSQVGANGGDGQPTPSFDPSSAQSGVLLSVCNDAASGDATYPGGDGDGNADGDSGTGDTPALALNNGPADGGGDGATPDGTTQGAAPDTGAPDSGSNVAETVYDQAAVPMDAVPQNGRYLNLFNVTSAKVTVYVQYHAVDQNNQWNWYPADPAASDQALAFELEPGQAAEARDGDWRVCADRVRVWAVSADGQQSWIRYQTRDLMLVPEVDDQGNPGYAAPTAETVNFGIK